MEKKEYTYIVTENVKTKHSDETFAVIGNFKDEEKAKQFINECAESVKKDWEEYMDDDWEEEMTDDSYELHRDDYEYYYHVEIWKKELK